MMEECGRRGHMAWLTPRRGPIPRDMAAIKLSSPFRSLPSMLLPHHRPMVRRSVPPLQLNEVGGIAGGFGGGSISSISSGDLRASTARGATEEEKNLFSRMSVVFKDNVLPELNDQWLKIMARQMGMPVHLLNEQPPKLETHDRAKRCAVVPPVTVKSASLSSVIETSTPLLSARASLTAGDLTERKHARQLLDHVSKPQPAKVSKDQRIFDQAIRIARLSRPFTRHINPGKITKSLSPRRKAELFAAEEAEKKLKEESDERVLTAGPGAVADEETQVIDQFNEPLRWPDVLWYTPHCVEWQKNAGKPKPPAKVGDTSNFKYFWDSLSEDEKFLQNLTFNQAYRGRTGAQNLSDEAQKNVELKAEQLRFMWCRQQLKEEQHAAFVEKKRKKAEQKAKKEEEERLVAEQRRREREEERRKTLFRITEMVFRALCTDPTTGLPVDPRAIFMKLDTDGGGTVDIDEFRNGIEACGCELSKEELQLLWQEIDGADGESDGEVEHEVLVAKLKEVNEEQLKLVQPKLVEVLYNQSKAAIKKLHLHTTKAEQSRDKLNPHRMAVAQRRYAFTADDKPSTATPPGGHALSPPTCARGRSPTSPQKQAEHVEQILLGQYGLGMGRKMSTVHSSRTVLTLAHTSSKKSSSPRTLESYVEGKGSGHSEGNGGASSVAHSHQPAVLAHSPPPESLSYTPRYPPPTSTSSSQELETWQLGSPESLSSTRASDLSFASTRASTIHHSGKMLAVGENG